MQPSSVTIFNLFVFWIGTVECRRLRDRGSHLIDREAPEWDYTSSIRLQNGIIQSLTPPEEWQKLYPKCGRAERQSPIDIKTSSPPNNGLSPQVCDGWTAAQSFKRWEIKNTGRYITMWPVPKRSVYTFTRSAWERPKRLFVDFVHFKWGGRHRGGSEHTINKHRYAAEMQVFHHQSRSRGHKRHALAFLIKERSSSTNEHWTDLLNNFAPVIDHVGSKRPVNKDGDLLNKLLKDSSMRGPSESHVRKRAVQYDGSLTIPPCSTNILWTVFITPIELSTNQLRYLRMVQNENGTEIECNARPIQHNTSPQFYVERSDAK